MGKKVGAGGEGMLEHEGDKQRGSEKGRGYYGPCLKITSACMFL